MTDPKDIIYPENPYAKAFDRATGGAPGPVGPSPAHMGPPQEEIRRKEYEETYGPGGTPDASPAEEPVVESPSTEPPALSSFVLIDLLNWRVIGDNGEAFHIHEVFKNTDGVSIRDVLLGLCGSIAIAESNRRTEEMAQRLGFSKQPPEEPDEEMSGMQGTETPPQVQSRKKRTRKKVSKKTV